MTRHASLTTDFSNLMNSVYQSTQRFHKNASPRKVQCKKCFLRYKKTVFTSYIHGQHLIGTLHARLILREVKKN